MSADRDGPYIVLRGLSAVWQAVAALTWLLGTWLGVARELIEMLVLEINCSTIVEGAKAKKRPHIDITYAFESVPQRLEEVRGVVSAFPCMT